MHLNGVYGILNIGGGISATEIKGSIWMNILDIQRLLRRVFGKRIINQILLQYEKGGFPKHK